MYVVLTLLSLLPVMVVVQVVRIHLGEGSTLREQGRSQAHTQREIPAMRGAIVDQAGRTLAVNAARFDVAIDPTVEGFRAVEASFFERLSKLTGIRQSVLRGRVDRTNSPKYDLLVRNISVREQEAIASWDIPGVILEPKFARRYNYGATAAHLLGHVNTDGTGMSGLEKQYEAFLHGTPGKRSFQRDRNKNLKADVGGTEVDPQHGETLVLTIDLVRQTILEEELARGVEMSGSNWGTAVAMDPHTGAIMALANVPTYNPNRVTGNTARRRNRALVDYMEPGSTFKLVSSVAAIEKGVVALGDTIDTGQGYGVFGGRGMHDTHAYGRIPFREVIAKSSNVGMATVAERLEAGDLYQYARNLGFGNPTWIDLPGEVQGTLHRPSTWSATSHSRLAIGYGVNVTPLQLLTAYSALANGGLLVQPYLVAERRDVTGRVTWQARQDSIRRVFEPHTAATLLPAFEEVVEDGTAKQARVDGLRIAGKTGTARKADGGAGYREGAYRATFVGFFPADDPQVALVVVMDEPESSIYGGGVAAPVFQRIAERWLPTLPQVAQRIAPPDALPPPLLVVPPDEPLPTEMETLPDLTGRSLRTAAAWLQAQGVQVRIEGHGAVRRQQPAAGATLPKEIILYGQS